MIRLVLALALTTLYGCTSVVADKADAPEEYPTGYEASCKAALHAGDYRG